MWGDERFKQLSSLKPSGQALWMYLLTGPQTSIIPGLFRAGRAGMAENLRWPPEEFEQCFREVLEQGMVKADFENQLVWIPGALKYNPPASPNVVKSWWKEFSVLPQCKLKDNAGRAICKELRRLGASFRGAFRPKRPSLKASPKASRKRLHSASPKPLAMGSRKPLPNQEQDQAQEQEEKTPPPHLPQAGGSCRIPRHCLQLAERAAVGCSIVSKAVKRILAEVIKIELESGCEPENTCNDLVESWKAYNRSKPTLKYQWGAEKFFGEGYWKDRDAWPFDYERMRLEAEARVGTYTPH